MLVAVKICGLADAEAVKAVAAARADYAGFVYYPPSPRHLSPERAAALKALLPPGIQAVSVLVNPDDALLSEVQRTLNPDYVQLHGQETPERLAEIRARFPAWKLIKAVSVSGGADISEAERYHAVADMLLFDAKPPLFSGGDRACLPGGNGLSFDWNLLKSLNCPLPWMLSGGLTGDNVAEAIRRTGARIVDVSSGVERAPGVKDAKLVRTFVDKARGCRGHRDPWLS